MSQFSSTNPFLSFSSHLATVIEQVAQSVVVVNSGGFSSTGIHWRKGIIVTSEETLKPEAEVTVISSRGNTVEVTLIGKDPTTDVAVFSVSESEFPIVEVGQPTTLKVGHLVVAVGRSIKNELSASFGMVRTLGDSWRSQLGGYIDQLIRLDLSLYRGCQGSPLVDMSSQTQGFITSGPRRSVLAIPATTINRVIDQLLEKGYISRSYLGVGMQPVTLPKSLIEQLSTTNEQAVMVISLAPEGPAERDGILPGDILFVLDGKSVSSIDDVQGFLATHKPGEQLEAQIIRGGQLVKLTLLLGERQGS